MTVYTGTADVLPDAEADRHILPVEESGLGALGTQRGNLPLESIDVRSVVTGLAVRTELAQGFRNTYDEPLEATYIFPLPDRSAVTALRMEADDRVIEGILKERAEARADYDRAISEGKRASIAEEERPGVFTLRVGNILPGERVVIRTTLAGRLPFEDGAATYRFPLVVAPRYIPGTPLPGDQVGAGIARDTDAVPDASRISPPVLLPGFPNPVRLGIRVEVDPAGLGLRALRSSLHGVTITEPDAVSADSTENTANTGRLVLTLQNPGERANRDFILRLLFGAEDAVATSLAVRADAENPEEGTFVLTLLPPDSAARQNPEGTDLVLVLDRSGSMDGWKMVAARRAAARVIDTLTSRDRFAALAFDDVVETPPTLPAGLVQAGDRHRFRAVEHLAKMEARGGTELGEPLRQAVELLARADGDRRAKALVLVTDGQVGNEDQILADLAPRLAGVRVHTMGIDRAVNEAFLRRLAQTGGGRYELVESEDRLDEAMAAIHRRIAGPVLTGLDITAAGLEIDEASVEPARLPDLFPGAPLVISGRFRGKPDGSVTVRGETAAGTSWSETVPAAASGDPDLGAYWARGRIRDLEDRYLVAHSFDLDRPAVEREIVATSLRFSVLCRFTSFVAVDSRVVTGPGQPRQVMSPVDAPDGWAMFASAKEQSKLGSFGGGGVDWLGPGMEAEMDRGGSPSQPGAPAAPLMSAAPAPASSAPTSSGPRPTGQRVKIPKKIAAPTGAKALAAELLARLRADENASVKTRVAVLVELADTGLPELLRQLGFEAAPMEDVQPVADLVQAIAGLAVAADAAGDADPADLTADAADAADLAGLERVWRLAVEVLTQVAADSDPPRPRAAKPFWKR